MNTFNLNLDLDKRGGVAQWVTMRQGDRRGTELRATIYDHGTQAGGGYTCRVSIRLPGAGDEYYRETATYTNGVAVVTVDEEYAAAIVGVTEGYFELLQGDAVIASTESFGVRILRSAQDGAVPGDKYDSAIEDALAELDEATGRISQMVVDATAEYLEAHPELTTTVEDNSLTDAKLIQKGGILSREQWLETMLPNIPRKTTAEADVHSVTDSAGGGPLGISVYGRSTQDGTPTPDAPVEIQSVTPNLLDISESTLTARQTIDTSTGQPNDAGAGDWIAPMAEVSGTSVTFAVGSLGSYNGSVNMACYRVNGDYISYMVIGRDSTVKDLPSGTAKVRLFGYFSSGYQHILSAKLALYDGSRPMKYMPYGNVGLLARGRNLWSYGNRTFTRYVRVNFDTPFPAGTYTVSAVVTSADTDASTSVFTFRDANDIAVGSATLTRNSRASDVVTIARPATYCYLYSSTGASPSTGDEATWADIQVEQGSTATPYQPYAESVTPIPLQGHALRSLPDGTRDEVTVDQYGHATLIQRVGHIVLDGSVAPYTVNQSGGVYQAQYTWAKLGVSDSHGDNSPAMSDRFAQTLSWTAEGVLIRKTMFSLQGASIPSTTSGFATWLQSSPVTLDYKLPTPVTIDLGYLDPALLPAPDLTAYVVPSAPSVLRYGYTVAESTSSNLAPVETSPATASHAVGTLLTLDGQLVKVTSAIAVGEAVTIGGNVRTTTIAAELAALA